MNYLFVLPKESAKSSGGYNVFPVGIAYVSAYLKLCGHKVFTVNLEFFEESTDEALARLVHTHAIDVIATGGLSRDYKSLRELIDIARKIKPELIVVVGGGIISGDPKPAMIALGADIGVIGQGEITMHELAKALDQGLSYANVSGLIFKSKTAYITTPPRLEIKHLDDLPLPDYDGFSFADYMRQIDYSVAYIIASRSCPLKCTFCFHPSGDKYRKRSLDDIFKEIDYLIATYSPKVLTISDELFAPNRARVIDFCKRIAPYGIEWTVQLRVCDVDEEMLQIMSESGCSTISYGIESADDRVLTSMAKKITRAQIDRALRMTYDAGIDIQGGLIFGDAVETTDTVATSLKWYDEHAYYGLELNMINIFPGTALYKNAVISGIVKDPIKFLVDGCPLINVSRLTDSEYRDLASQLYERNMRAKYEPKDYQVHNIDDGGQCTATMSCNKCGTPVSIESDLLHISRLLCVNCRQRHYLDPFKKLCLPTPLSNDDFKGDERIVLWGAGELCIKLLDAYPQLHEERFVVVDSSKSRQGYSVCGKVIHPASYIAQNKIKSILITVVHRKNEILREIGTHPGVSHIYLPNVARLDQNLAALRLERLQVKAEALPA